MNQPLSSARYQHVNVMNDSTSTEKSKIAPTTQRARHHRNISHASFPSDNSEDSRGNESCFRFAIFGNVVLDKAKHNNIKHSQSVLQFKDRFKVEKQRLLR